MVANMDKAVDFYIIKLGLELINRYDDDYAEIQAASMIIGLHPAGKKLSIGNNLSIGFGVADFDKTLENLQSNGIQFTVENDGWIRLAHFTDIDNNQMFLAENKN